RSTDEGTHAGSPVRNCRDGPVSMCTRHAVEPPENSKIYTSAVRGTLPPRGGLPRAEYRRRVVRCPRSSLHAETVRRRHVALGMTISAGVGLIVVGNLLPDATAKPRFRRNVGTVSVEIRDERGPIPARLTFRPVGDTPKLFFTTTDIGREEIGAVAAF